jgi:protein-tyrosine phosphatase
MEIPIWEQYFSDSNPNNIIIGELPKSESKNKHIITICPICNRKKLSPDHDEEEHMIEIIPHLYIGAIYNAHNIDELSHFNIKIIINAAYEVINKFHDAFEYKKYMWDDSYDQKIYDDLDSAVDLIHQNITQKKNVLVHCYAGKSRSGSIIVAYLIKYHNKSFKDALNFAKSKRPVISPNSFFCEQLIKYSDKLI